MSPVRDEFILNTYNLLFFIVYLCHQIETPISENYNVYLPIRGLTSLNEVVEWQRSHCFPNPPS